MSAFCRLCNEEQKSSTEDTYVSCNNCGSFACIKHHVWWGNSKNAFCTVCFPRQTAISVATASQALQAIVNNMKSEGIEDLYGALNKITQEFGEMPLEHLISLLNEILNEIHRRNSATDGRNA